MRLPGQSAIHDLEVAKEDIKREQSKIDEYEVQLVRLQEVDDVLREKGRKLPDPNEALLARKEQLLQLIDEQHHKLKGYHKARLQAVEVLSSLKKRQSREQSSTREFPADAPQSRRRGMGFLGVAALVGIIGLWTRT